MSRQFLVTKPVLSLDLDSADTNIPDDGTWVEITSAMAKPVSGLEIYNGTGKILELAYGPAASEVLIPYKAAPKDSSPVLPIEISGGVRLAVRCLSGEGTASVGTLVLNFFG